MRGYLLGAVVVLAGMASAVSGVAASPSQRDVELLRDNQTGTDDLTATSTGPSTPYVQPDTQVEPSVAVNPANSLNVVAAYQEGRVAGGGDATNGFATSLDGGKTWVHGELPGLTSYPKQGGSFDRASDAVVAFGVDPAKPGHYLVYANSLVFDDTSQQALPSGMAVNVSKDGGLTWSAPVILEQDNLGGINDKNWIVVDNGTGSGHTPGRLYVVWDRIAPVVYAYCDHDCDQLANWTNSQVNSTTGLVNGFYVLYPGQGIGSMPVVNPDGSLTVVFDTTSGIPITIGPGDQPNQNPSGSGIVQLSAVGAGSVPFPLPLTFPQTPIPIATYVTNGIREQRAGGLISAAVDPTSGTIYVGWEDRRFRTDSGGNQNDAVFSKSLDSTHTSWSPPARVNGGPTDDFVNRFNTAVAVGANGTLHVMYRQRQEVLTDPLPATVHTMYQESQDGGATFSTPLQVDTGPGTVAGASADNAYYGAQSRGGTFHGDYDQIAVGGPFVYITRCESFPTYAGEPPALTLQQDGTLALTAQGHQHQRNFVAVLGPVAPPILSPESQFVPGLALVGGGAALALLQLRRRRKSTDLGDR